MRRSEVLPGFPESEGGQEENLGERRPRAAPEWTPLTSSVSWRSSSAADLLLLSAVQPAADLGRPESCPTPRLAPARSKKSRLRLLELTNARQGSARGGRDTARKPFSRSTPYSQARDERAGSARRSAGKAESGVGELQASVFRSCSACQPWKSILARIASTRVDMAVTG